MALKKKSPESKFYKLLHRQVHNEFNASHQYVAVAVWFDTNDFPQLAKYFYRQAVEERNHALAIVRYLMDTEHRVEIPGVSEVRNEFDKVSDLIELALLQEQEVKADVETLAKTAREEGDYVGEQFMQWFLKEQVEEISSMHTLLTVARRAEEENNLFELENFLYRENVGEVVDSTMPPVAGGAL